MKTQHTRILLLILGALIIGLSVYCFNKYLNSTNEPFYTYQPIYPGDPLSTNNDDIIIKKISNIISATSTPSSTETYIIYNYNENGNENNNENVDIKVCLHNPSSESATIPCDGADVNDIPVPTATLAPIINNIKCSNNEGYLLAANSKTVFYYNQNINNQKKVNCLYFYKLVNNIKQLLCLALPAISLSNTSPQTTDSTGKTNMPYDKLRFISANDKIILAMGCSNTLYYYPLADGLPTDNNANVWKVISSGSIPIDTPSIVDIKLNDSTAFLYSRKISAPMLNNKLMFAPINIDGNNLNLTWTPWISGLDLNYRQILLNGSTFTVNNDVLWFASIDTTGSSIQCDLWWANLVNGAPKLNNNNGIPASTWQRLGLDNMISSITNICINNNFLVIYNVDKNLLIKLKPNSTTGATTAITNAGSGASTTAITNAGSGASTTATTNAGSGASTTATTNAGSGASTTATTNAGSGASTDAGTGTGVGAGAGTGTGTGTGSGAGSGATTTTGAGITTITNAGAGNNSLNGQQNIPTTTAMYNTTKPITTKPMTTKPSSKLFGDEYKVDPGSISGMFGISGNTNNHDNLNDFLANTNLVGNNLYISPMNNQELYNPTQPKINGKISSSFFPIVKIS